MCWVGILLLLLLLWHCATPSTTTNTNTTANTSTASLPTIPMLTPPPSLGRNVHLVHHACSGTQLWREHRVGCRW